MRMRIGAAAVTAGWVVLIGGAVCVRYIDSLARLVVRNRWVWPTVVSLVVAAVLLSTTGHLIGSLIAGGAVFGWQFVLQPRTADRVRARLPRH
jgi:hypothetical protein